MGSLEHQAASKRLVELLESSRKEVNVTAAWALRKVAVQDTVPSLIDRAKRQAERRSLEGEVPGLDNQIAHLLEALGLLQAEEVMPVLIGYIPKRHGSYRSRGAAIWAIGRLREGVRDSELETALTDRLLDFEPQPSETKLVKQMSAVTLGRMRAVDQVPMMQQYVNSLHNDTSQSGDENKRLEVAFGWALKEMTGEELPPPKPLKFSQTEWFLEPLP